MSYNTGLWGESRTGIGAFNFDNPVSANFSAVPLAGVAPLTVNFTDLSTGSGINSWIWDFGDGHISATQNPVHIYSSFGNKTVTLSASNLTNSDINIKSNYIFVAMPTIVANFSGTPLIAYPGETIHFTDTTTGSIPTNWNWNFGDGGTSNLQNPTHIYTSGGRNYDVYLQAFNGYTGDQITKNNYIQILPNVNTNFTATPITGFSPLTVNFTDLTTGTLPFIWQWDFGDGYGSSTQNPIHIYSAGGLYTVELNDSNGIISGSNVKSNYINVSMPVNQTVNVNAPINVFYQLLQPTIYSFQKDVNFVGVPLVGT